MKANCKALKLSLKISIISFVLVVILSIVLLVLYNGENKIIDILLNIIIGLFGSSFVALLLSIPAYIDSKRKLLEEFWLESRRLIRKISTLKYIFVEYDTDAFVSYIDDLISEEVEHNFDNKLFIKPTLSVNENKELLIKDYIEFHPEMDRIVSKKNMHKYASERVDEKISDKRKEGKKVFKQYLELCNESTCNLSNMLGDMEFFSGNKSYKKIYNNIYLPLFDFLNLINEEKYHIQLFFDGEGNEAVVFEKVLLLQKNIFDVTINQHDGYTQYIIHNSFFDKMLINLEEFRADMYDVEPEKQKIHPICCHYIRNRNKIDKKSK